jgi:hypothetical protein
MTDVEKAKYAGKLVGQIEAYASNADRAQRMLWTIAHQLEDIKRNANYNMQQLEHHAFDILTEEDKIGLKSTMRSIDQDVSTATKITGRE